MNYGRRLVPVIIDEAAKNTPEKIYASIPKSADLSEGFKDINYRTFANAINRASFWLDLHLAKGGISEKFAYTGPKDLRYTVLTVAAIKTGREIVLPSPFASLEAQLHVLDKTQCRKYLCPAVSVPLIKKVCALRPDMQLVVVPDWEEWLDEETVEHYVYDKSYEQAKEDTFMIVHTSGTTGLPRPVRYTNGAVGAMDAHHNLPDPEQRLWWNLIAGRRVFTPMPTLHVAGMACSLLFPAIFEMITVIGPGSAPVTVDVADQVHRFGNVEGVLYPPSLLEDIIRSPAAFEALKKLKIVVFGGAPIEKSAGEILSKTINIMNFMGGTEVAFYPVLQVEPEDWNYFKFHPFFGHEMEPCGEGIYEQVIHQTTQSREASGLFQIYPELKVYRTKDLFLKHPTKEGLWSYHGRTDDLIILSHGQTLDPITMEAVIKRHPRVRSVIIAGDGRKHPLVLIEPTDDALSSKEERENLTDDIWPSIQEANKLSSDYVQLTRPLVIVAAPGKPFTRLGKGSVDRRNTVRDYEAEIAAAFDGLEPKTA